MSPEFILRPSLSGHAPIRAPPSPSVSPEFILRPSLSALLRLRCVRGNRTGVAGVYTPAFVERLTGLLMLCWQGRRVAGVYTPAFVERAPRSKATCGCRPGVAGVYTPAFVERRGHGPQPRQPPLVSPEFILRPSLSAEDPISPPLWLGAVSPEFILRPSLSARRGVRDVGAQGGGVAGVYTPAFVERRWFELASRHGIIGVSPEFTLRPSLSDRSAGPKPGTGGPVAGARAPAFVEPWNVERRWTLCSRLR